MEPEGIDARFTETEGDSPLFDGEPCETDNVRVYDNRGICESLPSTKETRDKRKYDTRGYNGTI